MQNEIINIHDNDYIKYGVIKPPQEFFKDNENFTRIVVDSRIRDTTLYPSPNDYYIPFDDDITDVLSAQLIYLDVPFTNYLVNQYYNSINITYKVEGITDTTKTVVVATGDYTNANFIIALQDALNVSFGNNKIIVSYNISLDNYIFTSSNYFSFNFQGQTNNLAMLLGFNKDKNYISINPSNYIITSEFKRNFNYNNYIILDIDQFDLLKSIDRNLNKSFAMIPINYDVLNLSDHPQYIKIFSPPIPRMTRLHIQLSDRFGNAYDFQNQDHRFEILLISFKQKRKYGNIFV
jgi:hypothetical protein